MLTVRNLWFSYGAVEALHDVTMTMNDGRVTCVMGRNGVGKTTLMENLMGILRPTSGAVLRDDLDLTFLPAHRHARSGIALVPQGRQIFPKLTVQENLEVGLAAVVGPKPSIPEWGYGRP